jgi:hypothetical protein
MELCHEMMGAGHTTAYTQLLDIIAVSMEGKLSGEESCAFLHELGAYLVRRLAAFQAISSLAETDEMIRSQILQGLNGLLGSVDELRACLENPGEGESLEDIADYILHNARESDSFISEAISALKETLEQAATMPAEGPD